MIFEPRVKKAYVEINNVGVFIYARRERKENREMVILISIIIIIIIIITTTNNDYTAFSAYIQFC